MKKAELLAPAGNRVAAVGEGKGDVRVVVVREAQLIPKQQGHKNDLDIFASYAEKPLPSTILPRRC